MKTTASVLGSWHDGDLPLPPSPIRCELADGAVGDLISELQAQWRRYRKQLRRCQKKFSEEAIHGSRVETRRLLSVIELLAGFLPKRDVRRAERSLKRHLHVFDDLRDTQVQLRAISKFEKAFDAARRFDVYLRKREERFSKRTARAVRRVKTRRLQKLMSGFAQQAARQCKRCSSTKANAFVLASVTRAFRRAAALRSLIDPKDTATIHCTRVAFKRFRYMAEALCGYVPGISKRMLKTMHGYQTVMGDIQDAEVLLRTFDKFSCKKHADPNSARALHDELVLRRESLIQRYLILSGQLLVFWPASEPPGGVKTKQRSTPGHRSPRRRAVGHAAAAGSTSLDER